MEVLLGVAAALSAVAALAALLSLLVQRRTQKNLQDELTRLRTDLLSSTQTGAAGVFSSLSQVQQQAWERQDQRLLDLTTQTTDTSQPAASTEYPYLVEWAGQ